MRRLQRKPKLSPAEKARQIVLMGEVAKRITRDNDIVFIAGVTPKVVVINKATGKEKRLDMVQAAAVSETALSWRISLYALCRDERGNEYIKAECLVLPHPVRQRDIHQSLNKHHMEFMRREVNRKHLLTLAWSATTGEEPGSQQADAIFAQLGAWATLDVAQELPEGAMGVSNLVTQELTEPVHRAEENV